MGEKKQRKSSKDSIGPSPLSPLELLEELEELDPRVKEETSRPKSKPPSERIVHVGVGDPPFVGKVKELHTIGMTGEGVDLEVKERRFQDKVEEIRKRGEETASAAVTAQSLPFRRLIMVTDPATWRHSINLHDEVTFEDSKGALWAGAVVSKGHGSVVVRLRGEDRQIEVTHAKVMTVRRP